MATSKAIAAYRGARALELAAAGVPYDQITTELGYRSSGAVSKAMWRTIDRRAAAGVEEYRAVELARLEALQRAHWAEAMAGGAASAEVVLSAIEKRIRLLGLDRGPDPSEGPADMADAAVYGKGTVGGHGVPFLPGTISGIGAGDEAGVQQASHLAWLRAPRRTDQVAGTRLRGLGRRWTVRLVADDDVHLFAAEQAQEGSDEPVLSCD
jgi:hypothetical protein